MAAAGILERPVIQTRSEQLLEWLFQQQKHRRLTNDEWEQVRRCEHAIYCHTRRQAIAAAEAEEANLDKLLAEARMPDCGELS
jgi:hypothetical protein